MILSHNCKFVNTMRVELKYIVPQKRKKKKKKMILAKIYVVDVDNLVQIICYKF